MPKLWTHLRILGPNRMGRVPTMSGPMVHALSPGNDQYPTHANGGIKRLGTVKSRRADHEFGQVQAERYASGSSEGPSARQCSDGQNQFNRRASWPVRDAHATYWNEVT